MKSNLYRLPLAIIFVFISTFSWTSLQIHFAAAAENITERPFVIHQIVGSPINPSEAFAITSNYGVLKSENEGITWFPVDRGIKSFTHHSLAITQTRPPRLYIGAWGGGVSKSIDGGANWTEVNDGLGNTAVDAIVIDPGTPDRLYIATSVHFFRTDENDGKWTLYEDGLPSFPDEIKFKSLLLIQGQIKMLWLGTSRGLFYREMDAPHWNEEDKFRNIRVSALTQDEKRHRLWVGTLGQGLFVRGEQETDWTFIEMGKGSWINQIALDPIDSQILYVATRGKGVFKSTDGGQTWNPANSGLEDLDIRSLAVHPLNRSLLFAGTTSKGIFRSSDAGAHWRPTQPLPALKMTQIIGMLTTTPPALTRPSVPAAFVKCNECHGWTDPNLNQKPTYWRVPPNRRDWVETVGRMAQRARLTSDEALTILNFLTSYSRSLLE